MSAATITFDIDGQQVDSLDASWYKIAPCGCSCGVTLVALPGKYSFSPLLTEPDAWASFYEGEAEQMRRDKAAGFRMELGLRHDVVKRLEACQHEPKYGVPATPIVEGFVWAATDMIPGGRDRRHLVPNGDAPRTNYIHWFPAEQVAALCGRLSWSWSAHTATRSAPTCRRCEKAARAQVTS